MFLRLNFIVVNRLDTVLVTYPPSNPYCYRLLPIVLTVLFTVGNGSSLPNLPKFLTKLHFFTFSTVTQFLVSSCFFCTRPNSYHPFYCNSITFEFTFIISSLYLLDSFAFQRLRWLRLQSSTVLSPPPRWFMSFPLFSLV